MLQGVGGNRSLKVFQQNRVPLERVHTRASVRSMKGDSADAGPDVPKNGLAVELLQNRLHDARVRGVEGGKGSRNVGGDRQQHMIARRQAACVAIYLRPRQVGESESASERKEQQAQHCGDADSARFTGSSRECKKSVSQGKYSKHKMWGGRGGHAQARDAMLLVAADASRGDQPQAGGDVREAMGRKSSTQLRQRHACSMPRQLLLLLLPRRRQAPGGGGGGAWGGQLASELLWNSRTPEKKSQADCR